MSKKINKFSLYITLGIIIISVVSVVMSVDTARNYISTKNNLINEMKQSSKLSIVSLQKTLASLMASYSVNEYENLLLREMEREPYFAVIVEDNNMGKIMGQKAYVTGKIRGKQWNIINYDSENSELKQKLKEIYYLDKQDIKNQTGQKLGTISIYNSSQFMDRELNKIITENIINALSISLILILTLLVTIRIFILKPISNIISVISDSDDDGIPVNLIHKGGSPEISTLTSTINNMIMTIRDSRIRLTEQHNDLKTLSMATEQSPVSVIICTPDNFIEYVNPQFTKTCGFTMNEVEGRSIRFLFEHSDMVKQIIAEVEKSLVSGNQWLGEIATLQNDGNICTMRMSVSPISNDDGGVIHNIFVAEDITELKQKEQMLRTSQKMDAIGQLTGGIAHDFNNMLGVIMGNLELLKDVVTDRPYELERVNRAFSSAERGAKLTRKLLNFSRHKSKNNELTRINPFIENIQELIAKSVMSSIQVEVHLAEDLWQSEIDPGDLEDSILNLALNARDAMPNGGLLVIETANKHLDASYVKDNPDVSEGDYVMLSVSDSGTGMSKDVRKKIFDPFFSTKEFGKGTGLGLSMVFGFVQRSHGHIHVYSEEGKGSSFHIYLPRALNRSVDAESLNNIVLPVGSETVLIVDDEQGLAEAASEFLMKLGYKTRVAANASEALDILSVTPGIDILFSDVLMPGMDGFELSVEAVKLKADLKILLTSGFTIKRTSFTNGHEEYYRKLYEKLLEKPYTMKDLALAIRRILDE